MVRPERDAEMELEAGGKEVKKQKPAAKEKSVSKQKTVVAQNPVVAKKQPKIE